MNKELNKLLESQLFTEETKTTLTEAFNQKIAEEKRLVESEIRKEFSEKYEHDKNQLVESLDKFVTEKLTSEIDAIKTDHQVKMKSLVEERNKLKEHVLEKLREEKQNLVENQKSTEQERLRLSEEIIEVQKKYRSDISEHAGLMENFVKNQLQEEIKELLSEKASINAEMQKMQKYLRESRLSYKSQYVDRMNKLEEFVKSKIQEEVQTFEEDKKLLAEKRIELETNAHRQLNEAKTAFIKKAAKLVENTIQTKLTKELTDLKEDISKARENNFGRKIFETFAAEYMSSYLIEGTEISKLRQQLSESIAKQEEISKQLVESNGKIETTRKQAIIAEERAARTVKLTELLSPLSKDQKTMMSTLLEGVKTDRLNEVFARYLPNVMNQKTTTTRTLVESKVEITGDKPDQKDSKETADILSLQKLAGLR